jgi:hypothetical protein
MSIADSVVDVSALWHLALYSLLATVGLVGAYSALLVGNERAETGIGRSGWLALEVAAGVVCLGILGHRRLGDHPEELAARARESSSSAWIRTRDLTIMSRAL